MIHKALYITLLLLLLINLKGWSQSEGLLRQGAWQASLSRADGQKIPFEFQVKEVLNETHLYIVNGEEQIKTANLFVSSDSVVIEMPVFESYFKIKVINKDSINGVWIKGSENKDVIMPFAARSGYIPPAPVFNEEDAKIAGNWAIEFTRPNQTKRPAIGNFEQNGNILSGSILTPSGDYRYLNGSVSGDSFTLSTFDGSHAFLFQAALEDSTITGNFLQGFTGKETWTATRDESAGLPVTSAATSVREGSDGKLDFQFMDLNDEMVSITDDRYVGKVVILQIMGSWCPNCMDETAFLSEYYDRNKDRGVEVIALAYELSTDRERSKKSLQKFREKFNVQYPILITDVKASDPQKAEKTIPQLTALKNFPTTIFIDKTGKIYSIKTSFYGPASGEHHVKFKEEFEKTITDLLRK